MVQEQFSDTDLLIFPDEMRHFHITFVETPNKEKIIIGLTSQAHLTVHFGTRSKELDIHYTDQRFSESDSRRWKTLLKIPYDILEKLSLHIEEIVLQNLKTYFASQRINLGKLKHHNCYLVRQDNFDENQKKLISITKNGNKLQPAKSFSRKSVQPLYTTPDQIKVFRSGNIFQVFKIKRGLHIRIGFIWYHPELKGSKPFFVSMKNFNCMAAAITDQMFQKVTELGIEINTEAWNQLCRERKKQLT